MTDNAIHAAERNEWRAAGYGAGEVERAQACGHYYDGRGRCIFCENDARSEM